jgi:hypothetical protein
MHKITKAAALMKSSDIKTSEVCKQTGIDAATGCYLKKILFKKRFAKIAKAAESMTATSLQRKYRLGPWAARKIKVISSALNSVSAPEEKNLSGAYMPRAIIGLQEETRELITKKFQDLLDQFKNQKLKTGIRPDKLQILELRTGIMVQELV